MSDVPMVQHPGPVSAERVVAIPCQATHRRVKLTAGLPLLQAMTDAVGGAGAWFDLSDVPTKTLTFVRPAPALDDHHVAWYSSETVLQDATIRKAGAHLGRCDGEVFAHVHGLWSEENGTRHAGHLLAEKTFLSTDHTVDIWVMEGAMFETAPDAETGFTLFRPVRTTPVGAPNAVLGAIRPNEIIEEGIAKCAGKAGLPVAVVKGLGSLVGAQLEGETALRDIATEVLLTDAEPESAIAVGFAGSPISGVMITGKNRVCVTFEVLLLLSPT